MHAETIDQHRHIGHADIRKPEVLRRRYAFIAGNRELILEPRVRQVEPQKARSPRPDLKVVPHDVLDERSAPRPRLDVERAGVLSGLRKLAALHPHIAYAARGLAPNPDARKN